MKLERDPVAWMIMYKGCVVGPVETMEMTALLKARDTNAEGIVPLFRLVPPEPYLETDTPRTDDALLSRSDIGEHGHGEGEFVEATLARRLEFELGMANNKWELAHKTLKEFCEAFENRGETTSMREWNERLKAAYANATEILVGRLPYATPK